MLIDRFIVANIALDRTRFDVYSSCNEQEDIYQSSGSEILKVGFHHTDNNNDF